MSFIRYKNVGPTTVLTNNAFSQVDLSGTIDLSTIVTTTYLETNPMHVVSKCSVTDNINFVGNFYTFHFTVYHTGSGYAYGGVVYSLDCPYETESISDWKDFELSTEGIYPSFNGSNMTIYGSMRSPNSIDITIRSYVEIYLKGNV